MVRDSTRDTKASVSVNRGKSITPGSGEGAPSDSEEGPVSPPRRDQSVRGWSLGVALNRDGLRRENMASLLPHFSLLLLLPIVQNPPEVTGQTPRAQSQARNRGDGERDGK